MRVAHARPGDRRMTARESAGARARRCRSAAHPWAGWAAGQSTAPRGVRGTRACRKRNAANPMIGSRVQQTCEVPGGASRRSREERQGRNESGAWQLRADGERQAHGKRGTLRDRAQSKGAARCGSSEQRRGKARPGVDARSSCRWRGDLWTTPREEFRSGPGRHAARQPGRQPGDGPRELRRVSRGDAKATRAGPFGRPDPMVCTDRKSLVGRRHRPGGSMPRRAR